MGGSLWSRPFLSEVREFHRVLWLSGVLIFLTVPCITFDANLTAEIPWPPLPTCWTGDYGAVVRELFAPRNPSLDLILSQPHRHQEFENLPTWL